jgi:hypothetical protein
MRSTLAIAAFIATLGCSQPAEPHVPPLPLHVPSVGFLEHEVPAAVDVFVRNTTPDTVDVDGVRINMLDSFVVQIPSEKELPAVLDSFEPLLVDGQKPLKPIKGFRIEPGVERGQVAFQLHWKLPNDPPELVGIIAATFDLLHGEKVVGQTRPMAFVVQSSEGNFDTILKSDMWKSPLGNDGRAWFKALKVRHVTPQVHEFIKYMGLVEGDSS